MKGYFEVSGELSVQVDFSRPFDLAIRITPSRSGAEDRQVEAFGLPKASLKSVELGSWIADTRKSSSVNCDLITFCPHGSGTHTECVGHVVDDAVYISDLTKNSPTHFWSTLLTITPEKFGASKDSYPAGKPKDFVITLECLKSSLDKAHESFMEGLIIRTEGYQNSQCSEQVAQQSCVTSRTSEDSQSLSDSDHCRWRKEQENRIWTDTNPPYFTEEAAQFIASLPHLKHLIVDLPSVDKEDDGGHLVMHKTFFNVKIGSKVMNSKTRLDRFITEMAFIPKTLEDGIYLLNMNMSGFSNTDAVPSTPILFKCARNASVCKY